MPRLLSTAALSLALATTLPSANASAGPYWRHGYGGYHGGYYGHSDGWGGGWGPAFGLGLAGLALGGLLSAATMPAYAGPVYYDYPAYDAPVYESYPVYYGYGAPYHGYWPHRRVVYYGHGWHGGSWHAPYRHRVYWGPRYRHWR
jgi:hypothetical protein